MSTRIVLADDQELVRAGFRMVIDSQPDLSVVGEAATGQEAVTAMRELAPEVLLMDIRMPVMDGIQAARAILADNRAARIILLTTFDLDAYVTAGLRAGVCGFLLKDTPPADLLSAIRTVAAGDAVVSPRVTRRLLDAHAAGLPAIIAGGAYRRERFDQLTAREQEVLLLVAHGESNAEIAQRLMLSEATVKSHVGHMLVKLKLRDRAQIVAYAYETGLVTPSRI